MAFRNKLDNNKHKEYRSINKVSNFDGCYMNCFNYAERCLSVDGGFLKPNFSYVSYLYT